VTYIEPPLVLPKRADLLAVLVMIWMASIQDPALTANPTITSAFRISTPISSEISPLRVEGQRLTHYELVPTRFAASLAEELARSVIIIELEPIYRITVVDGYTS
jgi:hypothetical protein